MSGKEDLPDLFYARAFAAASLSNCICYAAEKRTGLQFYLVACEIHDYLAKLESRGSETTVDVVMKRVTTKGWFSSSTSIDAFYTTGEKAGYFYDLCGGGPPGDLYTEVPAAYSR